MQSKQLVLEVTDEDEELNRFWLEHETTNVIKSLQHAIYDAERTDQYGEDARCYE